MRSRCDTQSTKSQLSQSRISWLGMRHSCYTTVMRSRGSMESIWWDPHLLKTITSSRSIVVSNPMAARWEVCLPCLNNLLELTTHSSRRLSLFTDSWRIDSIPWRVYILHQARWTSNLATKWVVRASSMSSRCLRFLFNHWIQPSSSCRSRVNWPQ